MQTCLVIDESPVVRKIAWRILSLSGYRPETAGNIEEAEKVLADLEHLDIAIVSATLPDEPVEAAIRRLKAHPHAAGCVVLASLVEANLGLMTRSKRAGAAGFTYRPFDRESLAGWLKPYSQARSEPA
ncbi:response regulator [Aureimonas populi]|uniref:Response regulator n=1 Tax=Aureimonas populi TaxID=1701758 RepID=A0ABW5CHU6_9HYPH|nr:response regulator [Aureimonas populi]